MTPFTLYLMRHGEPVLAGRMLGHTDCDVTDAGIAACRAQAADLTAVHIVSSDLKRAQRCAAPLGGIETDSRWRELDFGAWDGLEPATIEPDALARFWQDPDAYPPPGGERWSALVARVSAAIEDLAPQTTLVVTHGGAMRAALASLCGLSMAQTWAFDLPYAAVIALTVWPSTPRSAQISGLWT